MTKHCALIVASVLSGCATSGSAQLESRVHALEREVSSLRAERSPVTTVACAHVLDDSVPIDTAFPFVVHYDIGRSNVREGDAIVIQEVRGTSPDFTVGGMYLVHGTYTLASADRATLGLHVTAVRPGEGCANGNGRNQETIARGSGSFDLAVRVAYQGNPHVSFYRGHQGSGGQDFGSGAFLQP